MYPEVLINSSLHFTFSHPRYQKITRINKKRKDGERVKFANAEYRWRWNRLFFSTHQHQQQCENRINSASKQMPTPMYPSRAYTVEKFTMRKTRKNEIITYGGETVSAKLALNSKNEWRNTNDAKRPRRLRGSL